MEFVTINREGSEAEWVVSVWAALAEACTTQGDHREVCAEALYLLQNLRARLLGRAPLDLEVGLDMKEVRNWGKT